MLDIVTHTNPHPGGGEDGSEKQGVHRPICAYVVKMLRILNHSSLATTGVFFCRKCLEFMAVLQAADEETLPKVLQP